MQNEKIENALETLRTEKQGFPYGTLLLGTVIGAVLGVLYAPKAGEETREQIGDWVKEKREQFAKRNARREEQLENRSTFEQHRGAAANTKKLVNA